MSNGFVKFQPGEKVSVTFLPSPEEIRAERKRLVGLLQQVEQAIRDLKDLCQHEQVPVLTAYIKCADCGGLVIREAE